KYKPAVITIAMTRTIPTFPVTGISLKLAITSPLRLLLLANENEAERLNVLDRIVLDRFLHFDRLEVFGLAKVLHQVGQRDVVERYAFQRDVVAFVTHGVQPDSVRTVHRVADGV